MPGKLIDTENTEKRRGHVPAVQNRAKPIPMKFDFSGYPIDKRAYSERPMMFLDAGPSTALMAVVEFGLIETGSRAACERWQKNQLRNLLTHATQRSAFWRNRMGLRPPDTKLEKLPIQSKADVRQQAASEGSLLRPADGLQVVAHATSGSSGEPVKFFVSQMSSQYNGARSMAQYFMDGSDLSVNRTSVKTATAANAAAAANSGGFSVEKTPSWLGDAGLVIKSGAQKKINYLNPDMRALVRELRKDPVGYLLINPRMLTSLLSYSASGAKLLRDLEVTECTLTGESTDPSTYREITELGIPVRSTYSSEEVGQIGFECQVCAGNYHVTTSNVIVEIVDVSHEVDGKKLGKVLVTHLHSYATPFIRYEMGDLALMKDRCPCGHDGPTIHSLFGRAINALKRRNGTLSPFFIRGPELAKCVEFAEFRIRQTDLETIVIEIGGRENLTPEETDKVTGFLKQQAGDEYAIKVIPRVAIDWGDSVKKQSFRCEVT